MAPGAVFGPQKGPDPDMVTRLDRNLRHLSEVIRQDLGREIATFPVLAPPAAWEPV